MSNLIAIGSDFECFVRGLDDDKIVSAIPLIPGDKEHHINLSMSELHHDNVLAEVNTIPAESEEELVFNVKGALEDLATYLGQRNCTYVLRDHYYMDSRELRDVEATIFGCDPDLNIFTGKEKIPPVGVEAANLRTAGGHIHISYTFHNEETYYKVAQVLACMLGLGATIMGDSAIRRKLYGQAGSVRMKDYGVEVRSPSNVWLQEEVWIRWVWAAAARAVNEADRLGKSRLGAIRNEVPKAINSCDKSMCGYLLAKYFGMYPPDSREELIGRKNPLEAEYFHYSMSSAKKHSSEYIDWVVTHGGGGKKHPEPIMASTVSTEPVLTLEEAAEMLEPDEWDEPQEDGGTW